MTSQRVFAGAVFTFNGGHLQMGAAISACMSSLRHTALIPTI